MPLPNQTITKHKARLYGVMHLEAFLLSSEEHTKLCSSDAESDSALLLCQWNAANQSSLFRAYRLIFLFTVFTAYSFYINALYDTYNYMMQLQYKNGTVMVSDGNTMVYWYIPPKSTVAVTWHRDDIIWASNHGIYMALQGVPKQYYDTTMVNGKKHGSATVYVQNTMVVPMTPCQKNANWFWIKCKHSILFLKRSYINVYVDDDYNGTGMLFTSYSEVRPKMPWYISRKRGTTTVLFCKCFCSVKMETVC